MCVYVYYGFKIPTHSEIYKPSNSLHYLPHYVSIEYIFFSSTCLLVYYFHICEKKLINVISYKTFCFSHRSIDNVNENFEYFYLLNTWNFSCLWENNGKEDNLSCLNFSTSFRRDKLIAWIDTDSITFLILIWGKCVNCIMWFSLR